LKYAILNVITNPDGICNINGNTFSHTEVTIQFLTRRPNCFLRGTGLVQSFKAQNQW